MFSVLADAKPLLPVPWWAARWLHWLLQPCPHTENCWLESEVLPSVVCPHPCSYLVPLLELQSVPQTPRSLPLLSFSWRSRSPPGSLLDAPWPTAASHFCLRCPRCSSHVFRSLAPHYPEELCSNVTSSKASLALTYRQSLLQATLFCFLHRTYLELFYVFAVSLCIRHTDRCSPYKNRALSL